EIQGTTREKRIEIPLTGSISVGRIGSNSFIIDDPSLSKIHASLSVDQDSNLSVADTGSTNGTYINGHRIAYGKATRFDANDKVRFGMVEVTFEFIERQGGIGPDEAEGDVNGDTVKIDGFEFKGRVSDDEPPVPQTRPAIEVELPADETPDETESKVDE
ncbi:MAG: FHA domain-containing protein, partial [Pyrinomonadaceae bacterium]